MFKLILSHFLFLALLLLGSSTPFFAQFLGEEVWLKQIHTQRNTQHDPAFTRVTQSVYPAAFLLPSATLAYGLLLRKEASVQHSLMLGLSLSSTLASTTLLKYAVNGSRPAETYGWVEPINQSTTPSFPSGHTAVAFTLATATALEYKKWYVSAPAFLWATTVGYTRVREGNHYPYDAIAGALIGSGSAWLCHALKKKYQEDKKRKQPLDL